MKKVILSMMFFLGFILCGTAAGSSYDPKAFADSIQAAIEKAVGAKASDRILGGYGYRDGNPRASFGGSKSDDSFQAGGIECPESVADVKQATELVMANLKSTFTNHVISIESRIDPKDGDTVLVMEISGKDNINVISVTLSFFRRPQGRVIILPNYFVRYRGGGG